MQEPERVYFSGRNAREIKAKNTLRRFSQLSVLWLLVTLAFAFGLSGLLSNSWRFSLTNRRAPRPHYPTDPAFLPRSGRHGIWTVCEFATEVGPVTWQPEMPETCYPLGYRFPEQVSHFARGLFLMSAVFQGFIFVTLSLFVAWMWADERALRFYAKDSQIIRTMLFFGNVSCVIGLLVATMLFLGNSIGYRDDLVSYSLSASKSTGAHCMAASILASTAAAGLLAFMLRFETIVHEEARFVRALNKANRGVQARLKAEAASRAQQPALGPVRKIMMRPIRIPHATPEDPTPVAEPTGDWEVVPLNHNHNGPQIMRIKINR